jgi:hypothetical protein
LREYRPEPSHVTTISPGVEVFAKTLEAASSRVSRSIQITPIMGGAERGSIRSPLNSVEPLPNVT